MRLDKVLAHSGIGSRKEVKEFIRKGYVLVNDEVITNDDYHVNEEEDSIIFADTVINYQKVAYYMLNKPMDYVSATIDTRYPVVTDLINENDYGLFPVGRLDIDTTGLLIISNDGALAHSLLSPKNHVEKKYLVEFTGVFQEKYFSLFKAGLDIKEYICKSATVELLSSNKAYITITEGKYHQVKKMFAYLGMEVTFLQRVEFGGVILDESLQEGEYRPLSEEELALLRNKAIK